MPDLLDDELAAVFADFRAEATRAVRPAELDQIRAGARRRRRRERTVRAVTGAVMSVAILGAGLAIARPLGVVPMLGTPAPQPTASFSVYDLVGKSVDLPPWPAVPGGTSRLCPRDKIDYVFAPPGNARGWQLVGVVGGTNVDVDRDGRLDLVAVLTCGTSDTDEMASKQVVAFSGKAGGTVAVLGQVATTNLDARDIVAVLAREEGAVAVVFKDFSDSAIDVAQAQERTYAFDGGEFRQIDGPTEFGPNPDVVDLVVTADPLVMHPDGTGATAGTLTITIRNVGPGPARTLEMIIAHDPSYLLENWSCPGDVDEGSYYCDTGSLAPGEERVMTFAVTGPTVLTTTQLSAQVTPISPKGRLAEAKPSDNFVAIPVVAG